LEATKPFSNASISHAVSTTIDPGTHGLDLPYWIEDPNFDIDFHVRHRRAPPGSPQQLAGSSSRIVARHLGRSRPLWELRDRGLEATCLAQLTKVHHRSTALPAR
jgi:hypothetical protein